MSPLFWAFPDIVYVLPDPVCPYTKTQPLYPERQFETSLAPTFSNMHCWVEVGGKMWSKWNMCLPTYKEVEVNFRGEGEGVEEGWILVLTWIVLSDILI